MAQKLSKSIGTWEVGVSAVALVVAASTLVSDFTGYFTLGAAFVIALMIAFLINLLRGLSAADLTVAYPKAGALYDYARAIIGGKRGKFIGMFLGLTFFGMSAFAMSGETTAGGYALQAFFNLDADVKYFIVLCSVLALIPNIFGIKTASWISAFLLLFMLGVRWFFGIAGFSGISGTGSWNIDNLQSSVGLFDLFGEGGILSAGLALAIWSFIGIEFACSLAEETKDPKQNIPRGIIFGLISILVTSLLMGLGVTGTLPIEQWQAITYSELGKGGELPQLAVGQIMFGKVGFILMALSSFSATLGSLTVAFAAMPRIIYSIARDGRFFGPASGFFGKLHPKFNTPVTATVLTFVAFVLPALYSSEVIDWVYSAAYLWILLYVVFHLFALINRIKHPNSQKAFSGKWFNAVAVLGMVITPIGLHYAFEGVHEYYGLRAGIVLLIALGVSMVSFMLPKYVANKSYHIRNKGTNKSSLKEEIILTP
ncbi:MAG: APC family permease [Candidatus Bathyarchaeota archaeon]